MYGLIGIYVILCVTIYYYFIFFLFKLYQLWTLGALSVGSGLLCHTPIIMYVCGGGVVVWFVLF